MMPYHEQETEYTCGPASARMVLGSFGVEKSEKQVARLLGTKRTGTRDKDFIKLAEKYGLSYIFKKNATVKGLRALQKRGYKIIVSYWYSPDKVGHYAVLKKIGASNVQLFDPWAGPQHSYSLSYFQKVWSWAFCPDPDTNRCWFFAVKK